MMTPVVMGLDPSLNMGWAILSREMERPAFGSLDLPAPRDGAGYGKMIRETREALRALIREHGVTHGFMERPILIIKPRKGDRSEINLASRLVLIKIEGAIEEEFDHLGLPDPQWVDMRDWRARFLGKTRPPVGMTRSEARRKWWKEQAIAACARRNWFTCNDNVAEACGIADFGLCTIDPAYRTATDPHARRAETAETVWP